ncbi:DUF747-domain-containing protein [Neoconidiobolus thromboides FSU 785]|nr:DUF747-domain-containing protein [Neoconidiobolus thromboides FSU 785]
MGKKKNRNKSKSIDKESSPNLLKKLAITPKPNFSLKLKSDLIPNHIDTLPTTPDSIPDIEEIIKSKLTNDKKSSNKYSKPEALNLLLTKDNKLTPIPEALNEDVGVEFNKSFSLFEHLKGELELNDFDKEFEMKGERLYNFFKVPKVFEKLMVFGYLVCLNSVLYNFTILPLRLILALLTILSYPIRRKRLTNAQWSDLIKGSLIITSCIILSYVDLSKLYHVVRGQSVVKLYVIFNMLEIADKLLSSLGQDLLNSYFTNLTLGDKIHTKYSLKPYIQYLAAIIYIPFHTTVLLYQMMSLNVSVNSYNDALLSLLMSNQFVEIKGAVFKKFERENLFQLTCSDIVERFQLTIFLLAITLRNMMELINSGVSEVQILMPKSFQKFLPNSIDFAFDLFLSPAAIILICEILVDWIKHSFVTKFNHIRPTVYTRYLDILCKDFAKPPKHLLNQTNSPSLTKFPDQSSIVARRLGLSIFPLTCFIIRVAMQLINFTDINSFFSKETITTMTNFYYQVQENPIQIIHEIMITIQDSNIPLYILIVLLIIISLTLIKLLLGIHLLKFSTNQLKQYEMRETKDKILAKEDLDSFYKESSVIRKELESSYDKDVYRPKNLNLDTIDRFSLFKSRVP